MPIPGGVLPLELAQDVDVVTRKAGLSPWHARLLKALERIADYYDSVPPIGSSSKRRTDA